MTGVSSNSYAEAEVGASEVTELRGLLSPRSRDITPTRVVLGPRMHPAVPIQTRPTIFAMTVTPPTMRKNPMTSKTKPERIILVSGTMPLP